ncbi:response regulator [Litoribrevibacter albus]|uniref:histidine kinase n=1 Tax=Litoribrevibacter albus TaxID=1473156 RepID=A0AA37W6S2_9GAMM|nr:response regulator [Litoribrevibacter albus]GLQ30508.1 hypothetical protein GCM10007876_09860 [Litoribrevibacter albus]
MTSNVLAVEGSKTQRAVLERLFSMAGMSAKLLDSTESLQQVLEKTHFDFICLGMHIPGSMNGLETCRFIRDLPGYQYTPIVLLTTSDANTTQSEAFGAGVTDIFNRNEMAELAAYLTRHIERHRQIEGRVLYIEDSVSQQLSMMSFLEETGLQVDAFESGEAAWRAFEINHYDLVLTDIVLPGEISGLQLVHKIRRLGGEKGDVPIIAITGYDDSVRRIELLQRGVNDYVSKPVLPHEVIVRVRTLINNCQLITQLKQQNETVEQQGKNQLAFLASISHDVRTPLNGILGILDLIRSDDLNSQHQKLLDVAMQSGEHLVSIIDDVLDLSRAEMDEFVIEQQPLQIKNIARNVMQNLKPEADRRSLGFTVQYSNTMPDLLRGDPKRLYQVLMNLIGNALKFTDKGRVDVDLDFIPPTLDQPLGVLKGSVQDTGRGIPQVQCENIFNKFQQVDAVARSKGGSGLGLAIVRTIVEAWGGTVGVDSRLGEGTRFWFTLPMELMEVKDHQDLTGHHETPLFQGDELKVLVVEDNDINRLVTGNMLDRLSVSYTIAENGQVALDMLDQQDFNLILMDCQMPVMDGYEASASIRHSQKPYENIYIIALTASAMMEEERKCYRVGMNDFLAKPVLFDNLVKAMNKAYQSLS